MPRYAGTCVPHHTHQHTTSVDCHRWPGLQGPCAGVVLRPTCDFTSTAGNAVSRRVGSGGVRWNVTWVADKEEAGQREGEGAGEAEADLILEVHLCCQRSLAERAVNEDPANRLQP